MATTNGAFRATLLIGWLALAAAGLCYAHLRGLSDWTVVAPALAAFLAEYPFYLIPAFPSIRERFAGARLPMLATAGFVLPYLACALGAEPFRWASLAQLIALGMALGLWYAVLPAAPLSDLGFGALVGWVILGHYFDGVYHTPLPHLELGILGKLAVFQSAALALMVGRHVPETGFGLWPTLKDWKTGGLNFLCFAVVGFPLALGIKAVSFGFAKQPATVVGAFFGTLWVVALFEEFFFRGVMLPMLERYSGATAALWITSAAFGLVHLPFRGFPNWRWVLVAGTMGWFCGRARNQSGGIRAAIVTHTLTVTAWRAFFA